MKKVLIWNDYPLGPVGGPSGYLFNLRQYFRENKVEGIDFFNNEEFFKEKKIEEKKYFSGIRKILKEFRQNIGKTKKMEKRMDRSYREYEGDFSSIQEYDLIHFHDARSLYRIRNHLKEYRGKIILSSHCPKTPALEEIEDNFKMDVSKFPLHLKKRLEEVDRYAFTRADYLLFPCQEAQEPYEENLEIKSILGQKLKEGKILYVPTGIPLKRIEKETNFFQDRGIDTEKKFIISYIGRHNKVKGYDFLKAFGEKILEKYEDVTFVLGGEIDEKNPPIEHRRWVELGWTREGYNVIKNSNIFMLPNEKTYFDLILLEVLSMGTPVLLSRTGGNRYFEAFQKKGLFYFEKNNLEEALKEFDKIYRLWKSGDLSKEGEKNLELFNRYFTLDTFGKNYIDTYEKLRKG